MLSLLEAGATVAGMAVVLLLCVAAVVKLGDRDAFTASLRTTRLRPLARPLSFAVPAGELAVVAMVPAVGLRAASLAALALLLAMTLFAAREMDRQTTCACFGVSWSSASRQGSLRRNALLCVLAAVAGWAAPAGLPAVALVLAGACIAAAVLLAESSRGQAQRA